MVKWTFLTGLNRTTVENCGKMDVVVVLWCFCGGVVVRWCFCGGGVFCGGVVFLWWCGGVIKDCHQTSPKVLLK